MKYLMTIFLLGLVILFHEIGHFVFASAVRMPISIFSIGFGPKLFSFHRKGTEYRISLIPVGGYVLPAVEDEEEFFALPLYKRVMMTLGGPVASFVLPLLCYAVFFTVKQGFSFEAALIMPIKQTLVFLGMMIGSLATIFQGGGQVAGIIGIVSQGSSFVGGNMLNALHFMALLSLNLFILNMLPVPVLDGGKLLLYLIECISPKSKKLQYPLALAGWVFMIGLMIYATALDIGNIVKSII